MGLFAKKKPDIEEFARVIDWSPQWDYGAPTPRVFSNGHKTYLIYYVEEGFEELTEPIDIEQLHSKEFPYPLCLVEFSGNTFRFGIANDEVFSGLSLSNRGLELYSAHIIENSSWIDELKKIHKVHPSFNEDRWKSKKHFVLIFHDEIFEIIATDYKIEIFQSTFEELSIEVCKRMN